MAFGAGHGQDVGDRVDQVGGEMAFGNIAGRAALQGLRGDLLAAVGGHENDGHGREIAT